MVESWIFKIFLAGSCDSRLQRLVHSLWNSWWWWDWGWRRRRRTRLGPKPRKKKASGKVFLFIKEKGSIKNEILSNFVFFFKLSLRIKTPVCFDANVLFCKSRQKKPAGKVLNSHILNNFNRRNASFWPLKIIFFCVLNGRVRSPISDFFFKQRIVFRRDGGLP